MNRNASFEIDYWNADDVAELRAKLDRQGYLFLRDSMNKESSLNLRRKILKICRDQGWIKAKQKLGDALWSGSGPFYEYDPEFMQTYQKIQELSAISSFSLDSGILIKYNISTLSNLVN